MAATDLERLVVSLDADIRKFEKELRRANNVADGQFRQIERRGTQSAKNLSNAFGKLSLGSIGKNAFAGFAAGAASALAPVAVLTAAINGTRKALADFGKLADDIKPTGLKPELYQALSLAALEAGSSQEELNAAMLIFAKNVGLAQSGTGPLVAGLKKLNPELLKTLVNAKDQDQRLRLVAEAMKEAGSATQQAALAAVAFGRGGVKIVEALKGGSAAIDEFIRKGKEMGILLTEGDLAEADALADKMDVLAFAITTNLNRALVKLAPLLVAGAEGMAKFAKAAADLSNKEINFEGLSTLLGPQLRLLDPSGNLGAGLSKIGAEADELVGKLSNGSDAVKELATTIRQVLSNSITLIPPEQIASLDALINKLGENGEGAAALKQKLLELGTSNPEFAALAARLDPLLEKLIASEAAARGLGSALGALPDERVIDRSGGEASEFFAGRRSDAGRSNSQRELDVRSEQVLNDAKEKGIELTEAAAKAEAERELALEDAQKERESAAKSAEKGGNDALKEANSDREHQNELIRDTIASLQEENAAISFETEHINDSNAVREEARVVTETLNRLTAEGITITDDLRAAVEREAAARGQQVASYDAAAASMEAAEVAADELARAQEDLAAQQAEVNDAFRDSMKGFISDLAHGKSLTDALTDALGRLADKLLDMALDNLLGQSGSSGFGLLGGLFGGGGGGGASAPFQTNTTFAQYLGAGGSAVGGAVGGGGATAGYPSTNLSAFAGAGTISGTTRMGADLAAIRTSTGLTAQVNAKYAQQFQGFVNDLEQTGYKIKSIGGYNFRNIAGSSRLSNHAYGNAIDINPATNPDTGRGGALITDLPPGVGEMANRRGFSWGGDWRSKKDAMHFEVANADKASVALEKLGTSATMTTESVDSLGQGSSAALSSFGQATVDATKGLGQFGASLSSFLSSSMGGGSSWFQGLSGLFGGAGGAFNFMNSISPAATASIIGAGGGFTGLFADGGYTGDMGTGTPAGIVHGGEFVMNAAATSRNRALLEALNNGMPGYAAGGFVLPRLGRSGSRDGTHGRSSPNNVSIIVNTPDAPSFMRSQNQIAAKAGATVNRFNRTQ